ncbi:1,2-phenylacetyl-CoA epoxidase subunit PaaE [Corynebacterium cystitidis]|uniref:Ring-1,2-phenylacetyl-CoA epoxidase subunit PaaE n=1 Tax=Corynebacterium cystitidis DSM 20524 TaxID=1121357 RepID=A0A1H9TQ96_9CORY|nr:1,2-phenylacetyl-CoA epoxidase subunit PaaE [Corynebacterium cystitidis]WJY82002.1 1,2-phenylacetyl-CoA epoxidase, subunit E [Corynebacterium cystitidis DSM 20524]SER99184.1 ring-1,2-phenylacetyl-CoA epoxidase subunit PaaE [Corynebacterium cystitidis DSM 20524]SNV80997.1 phenylacetic acid degradation NADH oxidoreductase [Corynebacterium cystitidis]
MTTPAKKKAKFNTLSVSRVRQLTDTSVEVSFDVPEALQDDYDYIPGQYVALRATIDGEELRRSYSICDIPNKGTIRVGIKKDLGGRFSTWANEELQPGDTIDVMNPQGGFTSKIHVTSLNDAKELVDKDLAKVDQPHLVAIAAGSGITPIMAIATAVLDAIPDAKFQLVYSNKGGGDVMFADKIGDLKDKYPARFAVHHVLTREQRVNPLFSGRIDDEKLQILLDQVIRPETVDEWFLCGPFELVQLCRDSLKDRGIDEKNIRYELFTTGDPKNEPGGNKGRAVVADPSGNNIDIQFQLDGLSGSVESPVSAKETVLNAALRVRPDVPFACAGGVCGTCRAKVIEGDYEMDENYALEADEVEAGYVLTCQTRPTGKSITVDYDA